MKNIFKNSYFGKLYETRDGRKAVYLGDNTCWIEGGETEIGYSRNGLFVDFQEHGIDIVSECSEENNEEELEELLAEQNYPYPLYDKSDMCVGHSNDGLTKVL